MATQTFLCAGVCGVDGCLMEFPTEKELTMHCINYDETQVQSKRPFCAQCFMIFDEFDNHVVHQCEVGKAQAQISMAISQSDTTIIDLTVGGHLEDFCSFRHEAWSVTKAPCLSRSSSSSTDEDGFLDQTVIPASAATKRKSSEEISAFETARKSPRLEARLSKNTSPALTANTQTQVHKAPDGNMDKPIPLLPSAAKLSSRQKNRAKQQKPVITTSTPLTAQPRLQTHKSRLLTASIATEAAKKLDSKSAVHPVSSKPAPENVGIFWDIENIAIPNNINVSSLVRKVRNSFVTGDKREVEFMCVCDVHKEKRHIINELNSCNVTIVHVDCFSKNAADEKLKHYLHRFAQTYPSPGTAVVLSGDVNFAPVLSNLSCFYTLHTVLIHNLQCSPRLKDSAKQTILFDEFIQGIGPSREITHHQPTFLLLEKLPLMSYSELYNRIDRMCDNTGGKIVNLDHGVGVIQFSTLELCVRAQRRLNNHCLKPGTPPIRALFAPETIKTFK